MTLETTPLRPVIAAYVEKFPNTRILLDWVANIMENREVCERGVVAGGFPFKLLAGLPFEASDIDIFGLRRANFNVLADMFARLERVTVVKNTGNVLTLHLDDKNFNRDLQIIYSSTGEKALLAKFDLAICKVAIKGSNILYHPKAMRCIKEGVLLDGRIENPHINIARVRKYSNLGFVPRGKLVLKIQEATAIARENSVKLNTIPLAKPEVHVENRRVHGLGGNAQILEDAAPEVAGGINWGLVGAPPEPPRVRDAFRRAVNALNANPNFVNLNYVAQAGVELPGEASDDEYVDDNFNGTNLYLPKYDAHVVKPMIAKRYEEAKAKYASSALDIVAEKYGYTKTRTGGYFVFDEGPQHAPVYPARPHEANDPRARYLGMAPDEIRREQIRERYRR